MHFLPPISRRLPACALLSFIALLMAVRSSAAPVTLYETGFEDFNPDLDLAGQKQWVGAGYGGNGLTDWLGDGWSAYVGYGPPTTNGLFVWRPTNHNPTNRPVVTVTFDMAIVDSVTTTNYDEFRWSVYNIAGDRLFSLIFDNRDFGIYRQLDNDEFKYDGWSFETNTTYAVELRMNFAANRWDAWVEGAQIVTNEFITTTNASRTFGDVDAVWLRGGAQSGDNYMVFDNLLITADVASVPRPLVDPPLPVSNGQYLIRVNGAEGAKFAVEASTNLISWTSLKTNTVSGGYFDYLDNTAAGKPRRYYRARWVP